MSGQATGWVLRHGPRDRAMRAVLIVIADAANRDGEHAYPGVQAIVDGALYSEGHVRRTLAQLVADGWLEQTGAPGPGRAAEYRIPGVLDSPDGPPDAARDARRSPDEHRADGARTARVQTRGVDPERRAYGARPDARPTGTGTPDQRNPPLFAPPGDAADGPTPDPLLGFADFWERYPRRDGKRLGRGKCEGLWRKLSLEDRRAAWRGAGHYGAACAGGLTRAKDPERWLRDRSWVDWQDPAVPDGRPGAPTGARRQAGTDLVVDRIRARVGAP